MKLLLLVLASFGGGLFCHVALWRLRVPDNQFRALAMVFAIVYISVALAAGMGFCPKAFPDGWIEFLHYSLAYVPLSLSYLACYSLIEKDSPSLTIVQWVAREGSEGLPRATLLSRLTRDNFLADRLTALELDGSLREEAGKIGLTSRGERWARLFRLGALALGLRIGQ